MAADEKSGVVLTKFTFIDPEVSTVINTLIYIAG